MIRINLAAPRPRPRVKRPVAIAGTLQLLFFLLAIGAAAVVLGAHFYLIKGEVAELNDKIQAQKQEQLRLGNLKKEVESFEVKQRLLKGRIDVIETLKRNQAGPVKLLEAIGNTVSLTETLWLTSVEEKANNEIEFKGMAGSVDAVANLITNLNRSGYFQNVEIKETAQKTGADGPARFEFTMTAKFQMPAPPEGTTPPGGQT